MMFMNEYEIEEALARFGRGDTPNLHAGAVVLSKLAGWTNRNSDGWPYWQKPARAAGTLMNLLQAADRFDPEDADIAEVTKAVRPIKAFCTRQGVDYNEMVNA